MITDETKQMLKSNRRTARKRNQLPPEIDTSVVYMTAKEVKEMVGASKSTIHLHSQDGTLPSIEFNSMRFYHPDDVEKYAALYKCGLLGKGRGR